MSLVIPILGLYTIIKSKKEWGRLYFDRKTGNLIDNFEDQLKARRAAALKKREVARKLRN